jgi:glycerophosphoryl diester phosphodiesterase
LVAIAGLSACSSASTASLVCEPSPFESRPPLVIAHAGGEGLGPPNAMVTMRRSLAAGADVLDVDLRMTVDGVVVAMHDRDVATTTDGTGNIDQLPWVEVARLDAGAHWPGAPIDEPVRVATLEEILTEFDDEWISLEIKQSQPSISVALCAVLDRTQSVDRVYLSSNIDESLYAARDACPEVLITTTYRDLDARAAADARGVAWCAPSPIGQPPYRRDRFDVETVRRSHEHGSALFTWTVDDPDDLRHLADIGIDGVYTRRPDIARQVFDEH